jgi:microcystin-dependent protein
VVWWGGPNIPTGWLVCNGQTVSRTTYASLFAAIGTTWGVGDSSTTFALPDARGRVLAHANGSSFVFGASTGAESHTLTTAEIPSHSHLCSGQGVDNALVPVGYYGAFSPVGNAQPFSTDATGGGTAHANIQPCLVGYHLIKT